MTVEVGYSPLGGMQVALDGTITYDFDGHISAQGIDLLASPPLGLPRGPGDPAAPTDRRIGWAEQSGGADVAEIYSVAVANTIHQLNLLATGQDVAGVTLVAEGGAGKSELSLSTQGLLGAVTAVAAIADGETRTLIDGAGRSAFLRNAAALADIRFRLFASSVTFTADIVSDTTTFAHNLDNAVVYPFLQIGHEVGVRDDFFVVVDDVDSFDVSFYGFVGDQTVPYTGTITVWGLCLGHD